MNEPKGRADPRTLILRVAIVLVLIGTVGAVCITGLFSSRRESNARGASASLKTIAGAEADFRTNDLDRNGVNDFWTADVKGLYTMTPAAELIARPLAAADADGTFYPAGGKNVPLSKVAAPAHAAGYWYVALETDRSASGSERTYRQDTGGTPAMGSVHHRSRFGFAAFPDSQSAGSRLFIVNEFNTVFRHDLRESVARLGKEVPPGRQGLKEYYLHWPDDTGIRRVSYEFCHCPECGYDPNHDP